MRAHGADFIRTEGLRYAYRKHRPEWKLNGIDLSIGQNEYLLIAGSSGSGKSTLCRTFNGLIPHFFGGTLEGRVWVGGLDTAALSVGDLFSRVGMVFQNPETQLFNRTIEYELAFGLESMGIPRKEMKRRILEIARTLSLENLLHRNPHSLSGGEQQIVGIAAILCQNPSVIVLDEPYANLDPAHVEQVRRALRDIHRRNIGIIVSEHRMNHTVPDADRMIIIENGKVMADGPPSVLIDAVTVDRFGLTTGIETKPRQPVPSNPKWSGKTASTPASAILEIEDITYAVGGKIILDRIRFEIRKEESIALLGANGVGKSTLLRHLNGLLRPSKGRIRLNGEDIRKRKVSQLARHIGMAFQNPASQFFKLTVKDEILAGPLALECLDEKWIDEIVRLFRLESLLDRPPYRLSGGEKKRVGFAAALAAQPKILVLDEPTAGQDGHFRKALGEFMAGILSKGHAVIFATHDLEFAAKNGHRWIVMHEGRILRDDSPARILADIPLLEMAGLKTRSDTSDHV